MLAIMLFLVHCLSCGIHTIILVVGYTVHVAGYTVHVAGYTVHVAGYTVHVHVAGYTVHVAGYTVHVVHVHSGVMCECLGAHKTYLHVAVLMSAAVKCYSAVGLHMCGALSLASDMCLLPFPTSVAPPHT